MKLELELRSDRVAPGGEVAGRVNVIEGGKSRKLTVTVSFHERSRDYAAMPYTEEFELHQGDVVAGKSYDFSFNLPAEAPTSAKTKHGELYWELKVSSDEGGRDSHASRRLEVG